MIDGALIKRIALLLILAFPWTICGQGEWEFKEEKNGIRLYSRDNEYSEFDEFRAETRLDQSVHVFLAVLKDIPAIPQWMYSVEYAELLEVQGDSIQIYYTEAKTPFPLKNRDGIYMNRFRWDKADRKLRVDIELLPEYLAIKDNVVRISRGKGFWEVTENDTGTLDLIFQMQVDPGGSIPSWLANMFVVDTPYNTLVELKRLMADERYGKTRYEFIE